MKALSTAALNHYQQALSTITICWVIARRDGTEIRGTVEARDVTVATGNLAGTYRAATGMVTKALERGSGLGVDNSEAHGALSSGDLAVHGITAADIEAGLYDDAAVTVFECNWADPDAWQHIISKGFLGGISYTPEGRYRAELRSLKQLLKQGVTRTFGVKCDAELGDERCRVDLSAYTLSAAEVTAVTSRRRLQASITLAPGQVISEGVTFAYGLVTWLTGANAGYQMEVKRWLLSGTLAEIELYQPMPNDIEVGDTFDAEAGCDKTADTCKYLFDNLVNFRGHGLLVPGMNRIILWGPAELRARQRKALEEWADYKESIGADVTWTET